MFWCFICGQKAVIWCADFDSEDYGYEWEGVIGTYECSCCGARYEVEMRVGDD